MTTVATTTAGLPPPLSGGVEFEPEHEIVIIVRRRPECAETLVEEADKREITRIRLDDGDRLAACRRSWHRQIGQLEEQRPPATHVEAVSAQLANGNAAEPPRSTGRNAAPATLVATTAFVLFVHENGLDENIGRNELARHVAMFANTTAIPGAAALDGEGSTMRQMAGELLTEIRRRRNR